MLFEVEDHVTGEGNGGAGCRDEEGTSPLRMGTQSEALAYKREQGLDWEGHKREGKSSIRLYFHKYKPYILGLHTT